MKRRKIVWTEFSKRDRKSLTKEGGGLLKGVATAGSSLKAKGGPRRGCSLAEYLGEGREFLEQRLRTWQENTGNKTLVSGDF